MAAKTAAKLEAAQGVLITGAVVGALGLGAYLIYKVASPLGGAVKNAGQTAEHATQGLENAAAGLEPLGSGVGSTLAGAGGILDVIGAVGAPPPLTGPAVAAEFVQGQQTLKLKIIRDVDKNTTWKMNNTVELEVTNSATGAPVPGATVQMSPLWGPTRAVLGEPKRVTDYRGRVTFNWTVSSIGPDGSDDASFVARGTGWNPSNEVSTK